MKTKIENLSFIVLISFQFGIGTDKTYSSEAISDLKKGKYFIDKCSSRDVIPLEESDNGCVEHNYVGRINLEGLNKLLWNWIYPDSITNTGGSLTLQYGLCEAIMFEGTIKQKHGVDTSLTIYKMNKAITGKSDTYPLPYRCQIAEGMAGYCTYSVCVTPVEETNGEYELCEEVFDFFESIQKHPCCDWEQRRYEMAKTMLPITSVSGRGPHGELILEACDKAAELAVIYADALIKELK